MVAILMALDFWKFTCVDQLITDWEGCVCVCVSACVFVYVCVYVCREGVVAFVG